MTEEITVTEEQLQEGLSVLENTTSSALADLVKALRDGAIALPGVWPALTEQQQRDWLHRWENDAAAILRRIVRQVATAEHQAVQCEVDSVTFKDGAKIVLKVPMLQLEGAHDVADHQGRNVFVVIADADFVQDRTGMPLADPDEPELALEDD